MLGIKNKVSFKAVTKGSSSQLYDSVLLKILRTLLEVFLRNLTYYRRKAFYEGYDKTNEFSKFK